MFFKVENLCFSYYRRPLSLKDVNFQVAQGEKFVCFSSKEMGKTTFLKVLSSFENGYFGKILLEGHELKSIDDEKKNFSLLLSDPVLFNHKTVAQNFDYFCMINNIDKLSSDEIDELLKINNIFVDKNLKVKKLSLFEKRLLAIARSLLKKPKIIFLDDQFGGLNENEKFEMVKVYEKLLSNKSLTIIATIGDETYNFLAKNNKKLDFNRILYLINANGYLFNNYAEFENSLLNLDILKFNLSYKIKDVQIALFNEKYKLIFDENNEFDLDEKHYNCLNKLKMENFDFEDCVLGFNEAGENVSYETLAKKLNNEEAYLFWKIDGSRII